MRSDISDRFTPKFLEHLDGRTKAAQVLRQRLDELQNDLGGEEAISYTKKSLCRRAIWLEAYIESQEVAAAEGAEPNIGAQVQALNSLLGVYRSLGLERHVADVPQLHEYLAKKVKDGAK